MLGFWLVLFATKVSFPFKYNHMNYFKNQFLHLGCSSKSLLKVQNQLAKKFATNKMNHMVQLYRVKYKNILIELFESMEQ